MSLFFKGPGQAKARLRGESAPTEGVRQCGPLQLALFGQNAGAAGSARPVQSATEVHDSAVL